MMQSGGPNYAVELGRFDGRVSTRNSVNLPHGNFNLDQLTGYFGSLGLSPTDMVALSGTLPWQQLHAQQWRRRRRV
jgi:peroxidase